MFGSKDDSHVKLNHIDDIWIELKRFRKVKLILDQVVLNLLIGPPLMPSYI